MHTVYHGIDLSAGLLRLALLGLAGVGALGAFLQVQLSHRAASITAVLEGQGAARPLRPTDEFARALQAADRVKGALEAARRQSERRDLQMGALAHLLQVGVVLLRRDLEVDHASGRALELMGSEGEAAFRHSWEELRPRVREALKGPPGRDGIWSLRLPAPAGGGGVGAGEACCCFFFASSLRTRARWLWFCALALSMAAAHATPWASDRKL